MQWAIVIAAFLASAVEFVEAFTLVLVAGITTNWRSAILGALGAAAILAVYYFFVGDLIILIGVSLTMVVLALITFLNASPSLRGASGTILIVGVLATLVATLGREVLRSENK